jgi:hypothetical protein
VGRNPKRKNQTKRHRFVWKDFSSTLDRARPKAGLCFYVAHESTVECAGIFLFHLSILK